MMLAEENNKAFSDVCRGSSKLKVLEEYIVELSFPSMELAYSEELILGYLTQTKNIAKIGYKNGF